MLMQPDMVAGLPIWVVGLGMIAVAVIGATIVEVIARTLVPLHIRTGHNTVAAAIFSVVGTTYAVLLAFVAMLAWEGFNNAQALTDSEASLVKSIQQTVGGWDDAERASMSHDAVAYARRVLDTEWPAQARGDPIDEDEPNLTRLTDTALHLRPASIGDGNIQARLLDDLAKLGNTRRERLRAEQTSIPAIVWFVLVAGGTITVCFASFLGAPSLRMHLAMSSLLAVSGALVLLVIVALSNPFRGDFRISAEPFERALAHMAPD
jgi:small-conductance mechanosensitive channel